MVVFNFGRRELGHQLDCEVGRAICMGRVVRIVVGVGVEFVGVRRVVVQCSDISFGPVWIPGFR